MPLITLPICTIVMAPEGCGDATSQQRRACHAGPGPLAAFERSTGPGDKVLGSLQRVPLIGRSRRIALSIGPGFQASSACRAA